MFGALFAYPKPILKGCILAWFLHKRKNFFLLRFISTENLLSHAKVLTFALSKLKQQTTN